MDSLTETFEKTADHINDEAKVIALTSKMPGGMSVSELETQAIGYIAGRDFIQQNEEIRLKVEDDRVLMIMPRHSDAETVADDMRSGHIACETMSGEDVEGGSSVFDALYVAPEIEAPALV